MTAEQEIAASPYGQLEALHTCHVVHDTFARHVLGHPFVDLDPELRDVAERVSELLGELYQAIGAKELEIDEQGVRIMPLDPADFLEDLGGQAGLLADAFATGDRGYIDNALAIVARARGAYNASSQPGGDE